MQIQPLIEEHTGLDLACCALLDNVLPAADHTDASIVKHQPRVQLCVVHKRHVMLPVVGDSAGQLVRCESVLTAACVERCDVYGFLDVLQCAVYLAAGHLLVPH
jgi:hypothetical protein